MDLLARCTAAPDFDKQAFAVVDADSGRPLHGQLFDCHGDGAYDTLRVDVGGPDAPGLLHLYYGKKGRGGRVHPPHRTAALMDRMRFRDGGVESGHVAIRIGNVVAPYR
jgi:hypothetical protein